MCTCNGERVWFTEPEKKDFKYVEVFVCILIKEVGEGGRVKRNHRESERRGVSLLLGLSTEDETV